MSIGGGVSERTLALGALVRALPREPPCGFRSVVQTPAIARNLHGGSINSALEIDLQGQIVAAALGARHYSGVGEHTDIVEGTGVSREHTSLMCPLSSAVVKGVRQSRIIGVMDPHTVVTTPRHLTGVIVSECGGADSRRLRVREHAQALIATVHPDFRDELSTCAEPLGR